MRCFKCDTCGSVIEPEAPVLHDEPNTDHRFNWPLFEGRHAGSDRVLRSGEPDQLWPRDEALLDLHRRLCVIEASPHPPIYHIDASKCVAIEDKNVKCPYLDTGNCWKVRNPAGVIRLPGDDCPAHTDGKGRAW